MALRQLCGKAWFAIFERSEGVPEAAVLAKSIRVNAYPRGVADAAGNGVARGYSQPASGRELEVVIPLPGHRPNLSTWCPPVIACAPASPRIAGRMTAPYLRSTSLFIHGDIGAKSIAPLPGGQPISAILFVAPGAIPTAFTHCAPTPTPTDPTPFALSLSKHARNV
jgi:hypothetical protein